MYSATSREVARRTWAMFSKSQLNFLHEPVPTFYTTFLPYDRGPFEIKYFLFVSIKKCRLEDGFVIYSTMFRTVTTHFIYCLGKAVKFLTRIRCCNCMRDFRFRHKQYIRRKCRQVNADATTAFNLLGNVPRGGDKLPTFLKSRLNFYRETVPTLYARSTV